MTDFGAISQPGLNFGGSDPNELFLEKWSGEVAQAYNQMNVMLPLVRVRTIQSGKNATFPATGRLAGSYHLAGKNVLDVANGNIVALDVGERTIFLDRPFQVTTTLDAIEEAMSDWSIRGPINTQIAQAISDRHDRDLMRLVIQGAQAANGPVPDQPGGTVLSGTSIPEIANADTDGSALVEALRLAAQALDEKFVPKTGRHVIVAPAQWYLLVQQTDFLERDFGNGANGSLAEGDVKRMFGFTLHSSTNLPDDDTSGDPAPSAATGIRNDYRVNALNTVAIAFHTDAVGTLRLRGLRMLMERHAEFLEGTQVTGYSVAGHGTLREEAAVQIVTADP